MTFGLKYYIGLEIADERSKNWYQLVNNKLFESSEYYFHLELVTPKSKSKLCELVLIFRVGGWVLYQDKI